MERCKSLKAVSPTKPQEGQRSRPRRFPNNPKQVTCLLVGFFTLFYLGSVIPRRISISPTESVGHYIFLYKRHFDPAKIKKNSLVVVPFYTKIRPHCWPCLVVKYLKCDSGDRLEVKNGLDFFCNGIFLGRAKTHSKKGVPVKVFQYNGIIPQGKFFAFGGCVDSYDSRYVGFIDKKDIKAIALPII